MGTVGTVGLKINHPNKKILVCCIKLSFLPAGDGLFSFFPTPAFALPRILLLYWCIFAIYCTASGVVVVKKIGNY